MQDKSSEAFYSAANEHAVQLLLQLSWEQLHLGHWKDVALVRTSEQGYGKALEVWPQR